MTERGATCLFWRGTQNAPLLLVRSESQGDSSHVMEARLIILLRPPPPPSILSPHQLAPGVVEILKMAARNSTPQFIMLLYFLHNIFTESMYRFLKERTRLQKNSNEFSNAQYPVKITEIIAIGVLRVDHATPFIRKRWQ
jgi:hypothetical protein